MRSMILSVSGVDRCKRLRYYMKRVTEQYSERRCGSGEGSVFGIIQDIVSRVVERMGEVGR